MPAIDRFPGTQSAVGSATRLRKITPHDTNELEYLTAAILPGQDGFISVIAAYDTAAVLLPAKAGIPLMVRAKVIRATGTTVTDIYALIN